MDLNTLFNLASAKSYNSRSDSEVWAALNLASQEVFGKTTGERQYFFVTWDTTSLVLVPGTEEYSLPAACGQIVRLRERGLATEPWYVMAPADVNDPDYEDTQFAASVGAALEGPYSRYEYFGPYLDLADAETTAQKQKIRVQPAIDVQRMTELVYIARYIEIAGADSVKVLPNESDGVVLYRAVAKLLTDNGDEPGGANNEAAASEREYLKWVRNRQLQHVRRVKPYIEDMD